VRELDPQGPGSLLHRLHVVALVFQVLRGRQDGEAVVGGSGAEKALTSVSPADLVDAVLLLQRRAQRLARAGPALRLRVAGLEEEDLAVVLRFGKERDPGARLTDSSEPEEIVILAVVLHDAHRLALRRQRGGAAAQLLHHPLAALPIDGGRQIGRRLRVGMREACGEK
jgi:hypothetical protein